MKLAGIRVIDLSVFLPGPYATLCMADHGAEVIKVEPPGEGDPGRSIGLRDGADTAFFRNLNRGKKSITLDLKSEAGREALLGLCETADVFVESFRPGVAARLGVDYAAVSARNPGIVYCSISAFGQDGPYRGRPAHDLAVEALAGVVGITLGDDGRPALPGVPAADIVAGLFGLSGILMALLRRQTTGRGDFIDVAMLDSMLSAATNVLGPAIVEDRQPVVKQERTTGGSAFYRIYATRDGRHLVLGGQEMKFVRTLLEALGRSEFVALCEQGPGLHQAPLVEFLAKTFATRTLTEWIDWFAPLDVCFAPVNSLPEALGDPQLQARGMILQDGEGRRLLGPVIHFSAEPAQPGLHVPAAGEHNREVSPRRPDKA